MEQNLFPNSQFPIPNSQFPIPKKTPRTKSRGIFVKLKLQIALISVLQFIKVGRNVIFTQGITYPIFWHQNSL